MIAGRLGTGKIQKPRRCLTVHVMPASDALDGWKLGVTTKVWRIARPMRTNSYLRIP